MTLREMRDQRNRNADRMKQLLDRKPSGWRSEFDRLERENRQLIADLRRQEFGEDEQRALDDLDREASREARLRAASTWDDCDLYPNQRTSVERTAAPAATGKRFADLFGEAADTRGFKSWGEFCNVLAGGRHDPRLDELRAAEGSIPSDGGFAVPDQFAAWLMDAALESEIVRPRATVWGMTSKTRKVPGFDSGDHSSSLFGGLTATWKAEGGTSSETYAKLRSIELEARKLTCYTSASNELVEDGMDFGDQLSRALIQTISWNLDYAFLQGDGASEPLGVLNDPAKIEVSAETGQDASTIQYTNLVKMFARLHPALVNGSVWIANPTTLPQLLELSIPIGVGGERVPVLRENGSGFSLLTRPVLLSEKLPSLGSAGDIILANFSQYAVGLRREVRLDRSQHVHWTEDLEAFRAIVRVDGQGTWKEAVTPRNGDSLSWVVTLAERS